MDLGHKLREERFAHQLRQKDLARKLGVTPQLISLWETGKSLPPADILPRIEAVLHTSLTVGRDMTRKYTSHLVMMGSTNETTYQYRSTKDEYHAELDLSDPCFGDISTFISHMREMYILAQLADVKGKQYIWTLREVTTTSPYGPYVTVEKVWEAESPTVYYGPSPRITLHPIGTDSKPIILNSEDTILDDLGTVLARDTPLVNDIHRLFDIDYDDDEFN